MCSLSDPPSPTRQRAALGGRVADAFTLLELLVGIAIIALMAGILLPTLAGARSAARAALCSSNLRQWALAVNTYATDNAGFLPRRGQGIRPTTRIDRPEDWFNALPPLLGEFSYLEL